MAGCGIYWKCFFAATWWLSAGVILYRNKFLFIGLLTITTGVFCLADGAAGIFQLAWLHELALNIYLFLAIIWAMANRCVSFEKAIERSLKGQVHLADQPAELTFPEV
ncbi:MAG: hypothetical protein WDO71_24990 [Bacteroidota bacterium]